MEMQGAKGGNALARVIDAHAHIEPESVEGILPLMDALEVETWIDFSPSIDRDFKGRFVGQASLYRKLEAFNKHPGRFYACCGINFEGFGEPTWLAREKDALSRYKDAGAIAVKIWKDFGLELKDSDGRVIAVDDERLAPLLDHAQSIGLVIAFHIADPKPFFDPLTPDNVYYELLQRRPEWWFGDREQFPYDWWQLIRQLERVVERHRNGKIVGAHFGCAAEELGYVADVMRRNPHYYVDTGARLPQIGRTDAASVRRIFIEHQDRIMFATDLMIGDKLNQWDIDYAKRMYQAYLRYFSSDEKAQDHGSSYAKWTIDGLGLPPDVVEKIVYSNAKNVFGL